MNTAPNILHIPENVLHIPTNILCTPVLPPKISYILFKMSYVFLIYARYWGVRRILVGVRKFFWGKYRIFVGVCRIFWGAEVDFSITRSHTQPVQEDEDCPVLKSGMVGECEVCGRVVHISYLFSRHAFEGATIHSHDDLHCQMLVSHVVCCLFMFYSCCVST